MQRWERNPMELTTRAQRAYALRILAGALGLTQDHDGAPLLRFGVSIAITPQETAALMDFAEEN